MLQVWARVVGEFTTLPFTYTGTSLSISCDVRGGGWLLVEMADATGTPLPRLDRVDESHAIAGSFVDHRITSPSGGKQAPGATGGEVRRPSGVASLCDGGGRHVRLPLRVMRIMATTVVSPVGVCVCHVPDMNLQMCTHLWNLSESERNLRSVS